MTEREKEGEEVVANRHGERRRGRGRGRFRERERQERKTYLHCLIRQHLSVDEYGVTNLP